MLLFNQRDEDIFHDKPLMIAEQDHQARNNTYKQPLTRAKAKQLQEEVNLFLNCYEHVSTKNYLLPNSGALLVLRFEEHAMFD